MRIAYRGRGWMGTGHGPGLTIAPPCGPRDESLPAFFAARAAKPVGRAGVFGCRRAVVGSAVIPTPHVLAHAPCLPGISAVTWQDTASAGLSESCRTSPPPTAAACRRCRRGSKSRPRTAPGEGHRETWADGFFARRPHRPSQAGAQEHPCKGGCENPFAGRMKSPKASITDSAVGLASAAVDG
jgi:hypothetical protein